MEKLVYTGDLGDVTKIRANLCMQKHRLHKLPILVSMPKAKFVGKSIIHLLRLSPSPKKLWFKRVKIETGQML